MSTPRDVRSIAVTKRDVVSAYESNNQGNRRTVLRATPPFSGRMRARLHVVHEEDPADGGDPGPIHVDPADLLVDPPAYPRPDDTEDDLRSDPDAEYTPEHHRQRHARVVEDWREAVRNSIADSVELTYPGGAHEVDVVVLGT